MQSSSAPSAATSVSGGMPMPNNPNAGGAMNYGSAMVGAGQQMQMAPQGTVIHSGTSPAAQQTIPNYASMLQRAAQMAPSGNATMGSASTASSVGGGAGAVTSGAQGLRVGMQHVPQGGSYAGVPGGAYVGMTGQPSLASMQPGGNAAAGSSMSPLGVARLPSADAASSSALQQQQQ
jgi:hypothetical protein